MNKEQQKQKEQKPSLAENLKAEKAKVSKEYERFDSYVKKYGTLAKLEDTLSTEQHIDVRELAKIPKYKDVFDNIASISYKGLSSLSLVKSLQIKEGMNLMKLKANLDGLKGKLKATLQEWTKTNSELERLIDMEKKRSKLFVMLSDSSVGYVLQKENTLPGQDAFVRASTTVQLSPLYNKLLEKIQKASPDEVNAMYRDYSMFKQMFDYTEKVMKAETKRQDMIIDLENYPEESCDSVPYLKTQEQRAGAKNAIKQSENYKEVEKIIMQSDPDKILQLASKPNPFGKYWEKMPLNAYQYANRLRLDDALKPYLKLKPKGFPEDKFLASLKRSSYYKKAIDTVQKGDLAAQKAFKPEKYINFTSEKANQMAKNDGSDTLYNYAKMLAENFQKLRGKIVDSDFGMA
jgi:hypothetical protein